MSHLRFSVVTPSFNQVRFIRRTIDSVLEQRGAFEIDYRVIDGGSTDGTVDILQSYGASLQWVSEKDRGQVDAINKGLRAANGDVVGWLNSDDVLLPSALARVARRFEASPQLEWVHGRCRIIDEDDAPVRNWVSQYKHFRSRRHSFTNLLTENYISQMTAFWRRSVHSEIGYLNPQFDLSFDYDFFLRLARRGAPAYIDEEVACFRWYQTSKSGAAYAKQLEQAVTIASQYSGASLSLRVRAQAKRHAILTLYRLMGLGRAALPKPGRNQSS